MPSFAYGSPFALLPDGLGPAGPFPSAVLTHHLDRRWLHYAFLARDGGHSMVSNAAWLGPPEGGADGAERFTTILLVHKRGAGWRSSQFNSDLSMPPWSAFRLPHRHGSPGALRIAAKSGSPE